MSFTSIPYLLFLLAAVLLYRSMPRRLQPLWILLLSCVFYALGDARGLIPLGAAAAVAYVAGLWTERSASTRLKNVVAYGAVALLLTNLVIFKELPRSSRPLGWVAALGISYYTFKLISYVLDVLWERLPAEHDPITFASFAVFFPQIVAGPIQRATDYLPQVRKPQPMSRALLRRGFGRIALGMCKKLVIADHLGVAVNAVYAGVHGYSGAPLLAAFYLFPIQLYADFSGLTDIAIGSALLLGISSPENFDRPFSATNISEYWRRWHMSLTNWTVDYVLTPLRMATRRWGQAGLVFSIFVNLMSIALWHGVAWTFFAFGLVHATFVSAEALSVRRRKSILKAHPSWDRWATWGGIILTFHLVAIGMVFWRARTLSDAFWFLGHFWTAPTALLPGIAAFAQSTGWRALAVGLAAFLILQVAGQLAGRGILAWSLPASPRWIRWSLHGVTYLLVFVGILLLVIHGSVREPFLYEVF